MTKSLGLVPQKLRSQSPLTSHLLDLICNGKFGVSSSVLLRALLTVKEKSTVCLFGFNGDFLVDIYIFNGGFSLDIYIFTEKRNTESLLRFTL